MTCRHELMWTVSSCDFRPFPLFIASDTDGFMTRYAIDQDAEGLTILVTETGVGKDRLLAELQNCQEGRCDCPTNEYDKVESLSVETDGGDDITMRLVPKPGQRFDESEIDTCLQHTVAKTEVD